MDPLQELKQRGEVDSAFIEKAEELATETGKNYESVFIELGMPSTEVRDFFGEYYQVPTFTPPEGFTITQEILDFVPEDSATHYNIMPLMLEHPPKALPRG